MKNQQLIDYIKQQTTNGLSKEEIQNSLLTTGWNDNDIMEAFHFIGSLPQSSGFNKSKILILIISITLFLIFVGGGYAYYQFINNKLTIKNNTETQSKQQIQQEAVSLNESRTTNIETAQEPAKETIQDILIKTEKIGSIQYEITIKSQLNSTYKVWEKIPYKRFEQIKSDLPIMSDKGVTLFRLIRRPDAIYVSSYTGLYVKTTLDKTNPDESSFLTEFTQKLRENSTLKEIGVETIDGKNARIIEYYTIDDIGLKIQNKLWLWEEKGMPLRLEERRQNNNDANLIAKIEYSKFIFEDIPDNIFEVPKGK